MRLYFNASWYINIPMWEQTGALCERIINGEFGTYSLTSEWTDLWNAGNQDCPELIWSYPQSRQVGYDDFYYLFLCTTKRPNDSAVARICRRPIMVVTSVPLTIHPASPTLIR